MSAAAIFYGQFASAQTPARVFTFTQRLARAGCHRPHACRDAARVRSGPGGAVMTATEESVMSIERERRQWLVALAFGSVDETVVAVPAPPAPVTGDVLP